MVLLGCLKNCSSQRKNSLERKQWFCIQNSNDNLKSFKKRRMWVKYLEVGCIPDRVQVRHIYVQMDRFAWRNSNVDVWNLRIDTCSFPLLVVLRDFLWQPTQIVVLNICSICSRNVCGWKGHVYSIQYYRNSFNVSATIFFNFSLLGATIF